MPLRVTKRTLYQNLRSFTISSLNHIVFSQPSILLGFCSRSALHLSSLLLHTCTSCEVLAAAYWVLSSAISAFVFIYRSTW